MHWRGGRTVWCGDGGSWINSVETQQPGREASQQRTGTDCFVWLTTKHRSEGGAKAPSTPHAHHMPVMTRQRRMLQSGARFLRNRPALAADPALARPPRKHAVVTDDTAPPNAVAATQLQDRLPTGKGNLEADRRVGRTRDRGGATARRRACACCIDTIGCRGRPPAAVDRTGGLAAAGGVRRPAEIVFFRGMPHRVLVSMGPDHPIERGSRYSLDAELDERCPR